MVTLAELSSEGCEGRIVARHSSVSPSMLGHLTCTQADTEGSYVVWMVNFGEIVIENI
jgi:hypothetical protein